MQSQPEDSALGGVLSFLGADGSDGAREALRSLLQPRGDAAGDKEQQPMQQKTSEEDELPAVVENLFTPGEVLVLSSPAPFLVKDSLLEPAVLHKLLEDVERVKQSHTLRAAGMGQSTGYWKNSLFRSDNMVWLSPEYCDEHQLRGIKQAMGKLMGASKQLRQFANLGFRLNGEVSAQLAVYPPNHTGYVRHLDSFSYQEGAAFTGQRIMTMVFYLNAGWSSEDGGHLRVFLDPAFTVNGCGYQDVAPVLNRVAIFRSDIVEHQVLPSARERTALTVWLYGHPMAAANIPRAPKSTTAAAATVEHISNAVPLPECEPQDGRIFVSIAAYRDPECQHTIRDLFATAANPARVFVGVVWQGEPEDEETCFAYPIPEQFKDQVRIMRIPSRDAAGPCWARHLAQSLWQGEEYFLQTDSHMRFRQGWDNYLRLQLRRCEETSATGKAVLTCYPSGYKLPNEVSNDRRPTLLVPKTFGADGMLRGAGKVLREIPDAPVRSPLWAAGFSFSRSTLITEVPYDRFLMHIFFGEEVAMAARMFTHGYDFYTPPEMVAYHLWSRDYRPSFRQVRQESHKQAEAISRDRIRALLDSEIRGGYGLGTARSITEFETSIQVSFESATILPDAGNAGLPPSSFASDENESKAERMQQVLKLMNSHLRM